MFYEKSIHRRRRLLGQLFFMLRPVYELVEAAASRRQRRHTMAALHALDDRTLKDIGITRGEIYHAAGTPSRVSQTTKKVTAGRRHQPWTAGARFAHH